MQQLCLEKAEMRVEGIIADLHDVLLEMRTIRSMNRVRAQDPRPDLPLPSRYGSPFEHSADSEPNTFASCSLPVIINHSNVLGIMT